MVNKAFIVAFHIAKYFVPMARERNVGVFMHRYLRAVRLGRDLEAIRCLDSELLGCAATANGR